MHHSKLKRSEEISCCERLLCPVKLLASPYVLLCSVICCPCYTWDMLHPNEFPTTPNSLHYHFVSLLTHCICCCPPTKDPRSYTILYAKKVTDLTFPEQELLDDLKVKHKQDLARIYNFCKQTGGRSSNYNLDGEFIPNNDGEVIPLI